ncbi:hypothetical protein RR46_11992 [Papilio xuthus]|uniref:Uncharacterized protein n=1 Tax=Papilio xuthus TaxID=66420 RepID=A0A194PPU0_PAPXU|nr:hypothetical protein RR46_11992 [Papilio xuthus]
MGTLFLDQTNDDVEAIHTMLAFTASVSIPLTDDDKDIDLPPSPVAGPSGIQRICVEDDSISGQTVQDVSVPRRQPPSDRLHNRAFPLHLGRCVKLKVLVVLLCCAAAAGRAAAGAVAWPAAVETLNAPQLNNIAQSQTKSFTYSTEQNINEVPSSHSNPIQSQLPNQDPVRAYAPLPGFGAYYLVGTTSYIPQTRLIYNHMEQPQIPESGTPTASIASSVPRQPSAPQQPYNPLFQPSLPEQTTVGVDAKVIKSAEYTNHQQLLRTSSPDGQPQSRPSNNYLRRSQFFQFAFPQIPQLHQGFPQLPLFPQLSSLI